jgi:hypothetical protein
VPARAGPLTVSSRAAAKAPSGSGDTVSFLAEPASPKPPFEPKLRDLVVTADAEQ